MFKFLAGKRIANSDDTFLTAINPDNITAFGARFEGYPLTVNGKVYYSENEVLVAIRTFRELGERIQSIQDLLDISLLDSSKAFKAPHDGEIYVAEHWDGSWGGTTAAKDFWNALYSSHEDRNGNQTHELTILRRF
jgi:hypothetical protein